MLWCQSLDHPYFVGTQFHPEYLTRPLRPSPPYLGLILAACGKLSMQKYYRSSVDFLQHNHNSSKGIQYYNANIMNGNHVNDFKIDDWIVSKFNFITDSMI